MCKKKVELPKPEKQSIKHECRPTKLEREYDKCYSHSWDLEHHDTSGFILLCVQVVLQTAQKNLREKRKKPGADDPKGGVKTNSLSSTNTPGTCESPGCNIWKPWGKSRLHEIAWSCSCISTSSKQFCVGQIQIKTISGYWMNGYKLIGFRLEMANEKRDEWEQIGNI